MISFIQSALQAYGDVSPIQQMEPVTGGSINETFYVRTNEREYFSKYNPNVEHSFFKAEVEGLKLLKGNGVRVPEPLFNFNGGKGENVLLLEWLSPSKSTESSEKKLGSLIAEMHLNYSEKSGLEYSNYIGELPQSNDQRDSWIEFYRDQRLGYIQGVAHEKGLLSKEREHLLTNLRDKLGEILNHDPSNSLLHGDLWGGNWLVSKSGTPFLIDPAVYYGDREVDIAFTYLFGGFSKDFYNKYQEQFPLEKEFEERMPVYQLFYLLVHLVFFGESYGSAVDQILKHYAG